MLDRPTGTAELVRAMRARLQPVQVVWVIAAPPAVEALPTDTEMATGEGRVASVMQVVIHPLEPPNRLAAQLPPQLRQLADSGWLSPSNLHGDTLLRVSPIILNENRRHHGRESLTALKAEYMDADPLPFSVFRLQVGGGPYISTFRKHVYRELAVGNPLISLGPPAVAFRCCPGQEKRTMR